RAAPARSFALLLLPVTKTVDSPQYATAVTLSLQSRAGVCPAPGAGQAGIVAVDKLPREPYAADDDRNDVVCGWDRRACASRSGGRAYRALRRWELWSGAQRVPDQFRRRPVPASGD